MTQVADSYLQWAEPDVAVAHWVIVVLQRERELFRPGRVRWSHVAAPWGRLARRSVNFLLYCSGRKVRPKSGRFLPLFLF